MMKPPLCKGGINESGRLMTQGPEEEDHAEGMPMETPGEELMGGGWAAVAHHGDSPHPQCRGPRLQ